MLYRNPKILCRTNKEVKNLTELGYPNTDTIHQVKGLEYEDVIVVDSEIKSREDLNIAYVALTRAKNNLMIVNYPIFYSLLREILWEKQNNLKK